MQPQSYAHFAYPRLNGWFQPAFKNLIKTANCSSHWGTFDEDPSPDKPMLKEYARDYSAVAALIRVCATWLATRNQIADQLRRPFSLTVVETGDSAWVESVENAFAEGLLPVVCNANLNAILPNVVCYKSRWRKTSPAKTASYFSEALALAAKEAVPLVVIVPSVEVLPDALCQKSTKVISLKPWSWSMVMMLFAMMNGRQEQCLMTRALNEMPSDASLARVAPNELMLALRTPTLMAFVNKMKALTGRSKANPKALDDVKGLGSARAQLIRLIGDIQAYSDGALPWSEIPNNVLFDGPPGVGKTYVAQKLAEATGAHFVRASYASWQAEGHLGDFLAAMREDFQVAKRNAPSVLLIDEIDSFADRATSSSGNDNYNRAALNGLLEQLAGAEKTDGVLVVGTTNYRDKLDAALLRSGRFDQKIHLPLPDREALIDILFEQSSRAVSKDRLYEIGNELLGQSGADAAALVRCARSVARQDGSHLAAKHLESALELFIKPLPAVMLHRLAIHEAGHIVVAHALGAGLPRFVQLSSKGGRVDLGLDQFAQETHSLENQLTVLLAGRAAELSCLGSASSVAGAGEKSDLAKVTLLAVKAETQFGLSNDNLIWRPATLDTLQVMLQDRDLSERVQRRLSAAARLAEKVVDENAYFVEGVARALVERRQMNRQNLEKLLRDLTVAQGEDRLSTSEQKAQFSGWLH